MTHADLERIMTSGDLSALTEAELKALIMVPSTPSANQRYLSKVEEWRRLLKEELSSRQSNSSSPWHLSWWGILALTVLAGLIVAWTAWKMGWLSS